MALTTLATDAFTRANNADLGAAWDPYTGWNALRITSNKIRATALGVDSIESYNAITWPDDQWSSIQLVTWNPGANYQNYEVFVRMATPNTQSGYSSAQDPSGIMGLYKWVTGGLTQLGTVANTPVVNNVLRSEIQGTALTAYVDNVFQLSTTVTDFSSGRGGVGAYVDAGSVANLELDNWSGGGFSTAGITARLALLGVGR